MPLKFVRAKATILRNEDGIMWASENGFILQSHDGGMRWRKDGYVALPFWRRVLAGHPLLRRITRSDISCVVPLGDGARLCVGPKTIFRAEKGSSHYGAVFRLPKGSRPLNLCVTPEGAIVWGEYFLNLQRKSPVRVYASWDGGRTWSTVHTFSPGNICHVHRVVYDPYDDSILVCTGDRDREAAIFRAKEGFRTLEPLVQGDQIYRTTCLIPKEKEILYATDYPGGENFVMSLDRRNSGVTRVQPLPGPVLYGTEVGHSVAFATMVEKQSHELTLWISADGGFRLVARFEALKIHRLWRELTGYPTLILPEGRGGWPDLYFTPVGTRRQNGNLMRVNLDPDKASAGEQGLWISH